MLLLAIVMFVSGFYYGVSDFHVQIKKKVKEIIEKYFIICFNYIKKTVIKLKDILDDIIM